jgi:SAM-dependent methyltransferase
MSAAEHWEAVYQKADEQLSWTQAQPRTSLELIREALPAGSVIDVGGGSSPLVGMLLESGYTVAVLDISSAALERSRQRLGARAGAVRWITADVTAAPELGTFDLWHDRAVFHFLMEAEQRAAYIALLRRTIPAGGSAIIATFDLDGPERCSGLPVRRYDAASLARELGTGFELIRSLREMHTTPWGAKQSFQYSLFRRRLMLPMS